MNGQINYRRARATECTLLSQLAYDSEAYWKYSEEFLDIFKKEYAVTEKYINENIVLIAENRTGIIGYYSLIRHKNAAELEYFYISTQYIGKGFGRKLWNHLISQCRKEGITEFDFVTSPQAVKFYEKMGAVQVGETRSLVDGRPIPKLLYMIK
jgi:GNAT superfamily N-acetyltransferase